MTVAEAQSRISEPEFVDWMIWFEWRDDMAKRARKGLPANDTESAEEMTPAESIAHIHAAAEQLNARRK